MGNSERKDQVHDPLPGVKEKPVDIGGVDGAQLPEKPEPGKPCKLSRDFVEHGIKPDPDPDDPVSP